MPWVKSSDDALTNPRLLSIAARQDIHPVYAPAAYGFYMGLVTLTAGHLTDGIVGFGEAIMAAYGDRDTARHLISICERAGLMKLRETAGSGEQWELLKDPEFVDFKDSWQVENDRQRKRDNRNEELTARVRHRDGDCCRWCGVSVEWADRRGNRGATYDHLRRGNDIGLDDMVVSCRSCNSKRNDGDAEGAGGLWLRPVPTSPKYTRDTRALWARKGWAEMFGLSLDENPRQEQLPLAHPRPGNQPGPAERPGRQPDTATEPRPGNWPDTAEQHHPASDPAPSGSTHRPGATPVGATPPPAGPRTHATEWDDDVAAIPQWASDPAASGSTHRPHRSGHQPAHETEHELDHPTASDPAPSGSTHRPPPLQPRARPSPPPRTAPTAPTAHDPPTAPPDLDLVSNPDPDPRGDGSGLSGTGRVGSGRSGSAPGRAGRSMPSSRGRKSRGRRGRR